MENACYFTRVKCEDWMEGWTYGRREITVMIVEDITPIWRRMFIDTLLLFYCHVLVTHVVTVK